MLLFGFLRRLFLGWDVAIPAVGYDTRVIVTPVAELRLFGMTVGAHAGILEAHVVLSIIVGDKRPLAYADDGISP